MYNNMYGDFMYICVDLDSTLLKNDKTISDFTLKVLDKCVQDGHKIIINTARNYERSIKIFSLIQADYLICNAGSDIYQKVDNSTNLKRIHLDYINHNVTSNLVKELKNYCEVISIQTDEALYTTKLLKNRPNYIIIDENSDYLFDAFKILVYKGKEEEILKIVNKYQINYSRYEEGDWARISPINVSKANSLDIILDYDNGTCNDVIAFGDDSGDIDFILKSGIGVLMKNGLERLKDKVQYICESNENDGVAKFLNQYFKFNI